MPIQYNFGSGLLFATPINGIGPSFGFGTLQDVSVDFDKEIKTLYGSNSMPDIAAGGKEKIMIKSKFGQISGNLFNSLYFGGTQSAGMMLVSLAEAATIPSTPTNGLYSVSVANASGANILANSATDLSVAYAASGVPLSNSGATAPTAGQYQVSNGVYTFSSADAGAQILVSYYYRTTNASSGTTYTRNQILMGGTLFYSLFLYKSFNGLQSNMKFFRVMSSKLSRQTKNDDFTVPEMDFTVFADPIGRIFEEYDAAG